MKVNDKVKVNIGAHEVAEAAVKEVNNEAGTVTLLVPATLVVMGLRTELTDLPETKAPQGTETIISGVDKPAATETLAPVADATPVVEPGIVTDATTQGVVSPEQIAAAEGSGVVEDSALPPKEEVDNG